MDQETFNLTFSGKLAPGFELAQVKSNLQNLFKIDERKAQALFSGSSIVLKKGLDSATANKYRSVMRKAGAVAFLVPSKKAGSVNNAISSPEAARAEQGSDAQASGQRPDAGQASAEHDAQMTTALGAQAAQAPKSREEIEAPDFEVAAVGADLLHADERKAVEALEVDTSNISLSDSQGNLVEADEFERPVPVEVRDLDAEVAPPGSDVLRPEERKTVEAVQVDTSQMSLGEVGERLSQPSAPPPPAPSTDHIKLK